MSLPWIRVSVALWVVTGLAGGVALGQSSGVSADHSVGVVIGRDSGYSKESCDGTLHKDVRTGGTPQKSHRRQRPWQRRSPVFALS
jgi:hypothetical protein